MAGMTYLVVMLLVTGISGNHHNHTHCRCAFDTWQFRTLFFANGLINVTSLLILVLLAVVILPALHRYRQYRVFRYARLPTHVAKVSVPVSKDENLKKEQQHDTKI